MTFCGVVRFSLESIVLWAFFSALWLGHGQVFLGALPCCASCFNGEACQLTAPPHPLEALLWSRLSTSCSKLPEASHQRGSDFRLVVVEFLEKQQYSYHTSQLGAQVTPTMGDFVKPDWQVNICVGPFSHCQTYQNFNIPQEQGNWLPWENQKGTKNEARSEASWLFALLSWQWNHCYSFKGCCKGAIRGGHCSMPSMYVSVWQVI